jgi:two-component system, cell cycle sensor histidine kinase and response regulator CckA
MDISDREGCKGDKLANFIVKRIKDGEEHLSAKSRVFEELNTLLNFSRELHSAKSYKEIGKLIYEHLKSFYFYDRLSGYLAVYDAKYDLFSLEYEILSGAEVLLETQASRLKEIVGFTAYAIEKGETLFVPNNKSTKSIDIESGQKNKPESSIVVIPLINKDLLVGCLRVVCEPAFSIDDKFVEFLESLCHFISIAISEIQNDDRAKKALLDSQRVISNLNKNLPGMAYRCFNDKDRTMQFVSDGCFDLTGYEANELLYNAKRSFGEVIHTEDKDFVRNEIQKALEKEKPFEIVYRIISGKGTVKWVLEKGTCVISNNNGYLFIEGFITDITDQKNSEIEREVFYRIGEAIHKTSNMEELLTSIHENIKKLMYAENCSIALYDRKTDLVSFPLYVDKFNITPPARKLQKGKTEYVLRTGEPLLLTESRLKELIENNVIEDKAWKAKSWLGVPLFVKSETIGVLALKHYEDENVFTERDKNLLMTISHQASFAIERKFSELEKNEIEQRFRLIWDKCSEGFRLIDRNGVTLMVNDAYCTIFKKKRGEVVGKLFSEIYSVNDRDHVVERYLSNFPYKKIRPRYENEITLWNEQKIWVEVSNSYLQSENEPPMVLSIFREGTDRKKLEFSLIQSQKMESTGRLAGGVAHDFNNLLTVIMGSSEMIVQNSKTEEKLRRYATRIRIAAQRGSDLSKQLLSFARLDKYSVQPLSINQVITDTLKLVSQTFEKSIEIKKSLHNNLPLIEGDYNHLQQVFMNLCINARDAMAKSGVLSVETKVVKISNTIPEKPREFPTGDYIQVTVSDTGTGMTEEIKQHIFEPFFTTKDNSKGTGLGLSIVYGIIQSHKGFIVVDSKINEGAKFKLHFPVSENQVKIPKLQTEEIIIGGTETILLVDDDDMVLETGKELLRSINYQIITASSAISALEFYKIKQKEISLIIIDLSMPKVNGVDLYMCLKEINPSLKALIASGSMDNETYDEILAQGVSGIILKPYQLNTISKAIRDVLDSH